MTRRKVKPRTAEVIERELEKIRSRLAELRAKQAHTPTLTWEGVSEENLEALARSEQERTVLPAAIAALEERELRLELVEVHRPDGRQVHPRAIRGRQRGPPLPPPPCLDIRSEARRVGTEWRSQRSAE